MDYSYIRYLSSKKTVDDRALNRNLWNRLFTILHTQDYKRQLKVLEVGAGIGTMIERIFEWRLLDNAIYTAIDIDEANIKEVYNRLLKWAHQHSINFIDYNISEHQNL